MISVTRPTTEANVSDEIPMASTDTKKLKLFGFEDKGDEKERGHKKQLLLQFHRQHTFPLADHGE